jgi:hypothetical protein
MKFFICCVLLALFASCSASIAGRLEQDSSGSLTLKAALEPKTAAAIRSLIALQGKTSAPVLDSQAINRSLRAAPGVKSASFKNTASDAVEGTVAISGIGGFLALNRQGSRFVTYEPSGSGSRLGINLDRESAPEIIGLVSRDAVDYLSVLMAPAVTGEKLSKAEYTELVRSVYGGGIADEIATARISVSVVLPAPVKSIKGGTASSREARFNAALLDILVLEQPLNYEIVW